MQKSVRFILTVLLLGSFVLSACAGAIPQGDDGGGSPDANSNEVIDVDGNVNDNGSDVNENDNDSQGNENDNGDDGSNDNDAQGDDNDNSNDNSNDASDDTLEFNGVVDAITDTSIVIDGVEYNLADFTEIKDLVTVGDQVKIHVIVNADGTFTISEIELSSGDDDDDDNSNSNLNSNDNDDDSNDNSDDDDNSNDSNSNDDDDDDDDDDSGNDNDDD